MNTFLGKCRFVSLCLLVWVFAYAQAQTTTAVPQATEYLITAQNNRTSLFEMIQMLQENHGIQTKFKSYKLNNNKITDLHLEFIPTFGIAQELNVEKGSGIEIQSIVIDSETNQINYVGAKSAMASSVIADLVNSPSVDGNPAENSQVNIENPIQQTRESVRKVPLPEGREVTGTYSIKSITVTDPSKL